MKMDETIKNARTRIRGMNLPGVDVSVRKGQLKLLAGEPVAGLSPTEALESAVQAIQAAGFVATLAKNAKEYVLSVAA